VHGIIQPLESADTPATQPLRDQLKAIAWANRAFIAIVLLPTLLVALYYYLIASDQYEARADFVVRHAEASVSRDDVGQILGFSFGTSSTSPEAYIVSDYLLSHDAVARLRKEDNLAARFRPAHADWISRLWFRDPAPERLLSYYRDKVSIEQDTVTGISHLRVHAFTPEDAYHIARKLLVMGEQQINSLNERTYRDQVATAGRELTDAETALLAIQDKMTGFRRAREDIDPEGTGRAQIGLVTNLTADLATARARLHAMEHVISRNSPQYLALSAQIRALESQIAGQSARIAGEGKTTAAALGDYEALVIRRDHAAKRYAAAAAAFEQARAEAQRKQLYLVRIVDANRPVKSLFPERGRIVLTLFVSLLIAYAIGWLVWAGIREHSL
jgi:capsular polysaccharide transport system permease protein